MTLLSGVEPTDLARGRSRSRLGWWLTAVGVVAVVFWFVHNGLALHHPVWVWVVGSVALAAWVAREVVRSARAGFAVAVVMVAAGALVVVPTDALLLVPVIIGIVALQASADLPVWTGTVAVLVAIVEIAGVATLERAPVALVLAACGGLVLGVLVGFSRRQVRLTELQARQGERDQQRAELLADRSRAARDVHDVLAHSLGGLVLQLDAVEALLEAGRVDDAARRAVDARTLAADGLAEARRAVRALREDDPEPAAADVSEPHRASRPQATTATGLAPLVDAHRSFGGAVHVDGDLTLAGLDPAHRAAVVAATREALSNARRHAPGRPVTLTVERTGPAGPVDVVVTNPLADPGHGLVGMRERFAELDDDATIRAERTDDAFVVAMHLPASRSGTEASA
ncbi:sensor histidine kinase [Curtobacterium sp. VKM Ac-1395]|uniref:sensor histidine kinase n=1 Tax=Curtobacterium sp. VKM Ac-1395 TaxID=2783815 RepID=UPI00188A3DA7|nr:histidine kinase [Curtobacterium sp. VKM Ac-1395]MBF4588516.1 two-component sensor histidine kinase [Curtobacterium sp. VKM Ac-1395]